MIIPNLLAQVPVVEKREDGNFYFTAEMQGLLSQLFTTLRTNLGNQGFVISSQSTANIAQLTNAPNFTLISDTDSNELKVKLNGAFVTVQTA